MSIIQRFGSALNLNIHFHMQFLDDLNVQPVIDRSAKIRHWLVE
ncbi:MAG: transposase [Candidatus Thiodiazotropha sp. (ex Lucinoma kastoroae)]|nr:transposase [Candidatus Thiodiazotropha sp. (ex Lucinoma kastoroae)]